MVPFLLLSDSFRHPVDFPACVFNLALHLFLLWSRHLRERFGEPPAGTLQDSQRHLQIALDLFDRRRLGCRWLPLRFQKQFRFGENALANHARAFAPGGIELPGLPRAEVMLGERRGHPLAIVQLDARHRHEKLHGQVRRNLAFTHLLLAPFRPRNHPL